MKESFDKNKLFPNSNQAFSASFEEVQRCRIPCFNVANKNAFFNYVLVKNYLVTYTVFNRNFNCFVWLDIWFLLILRHHLEREIDGNTEIRLVKITTHFRCICKKKRQL